MDFNSLYDSGNSLSDQPFEYSKELIIDKDKFRYITKWSYKIIWYYLEQIPSASVQLHCT